MLAALKAPKFQGLAHPRQAFGAKGDNTAAVIFVNEVDGDRFREIDYFGGRHSLLHFARCRSASLEAQAVANLRSKRPRVS